MKGDFSKWRFNPRSNYRGVLHQQGRVLLDSDWNDEVQITNDWQLTAGRDVIGPKVAAIPVDQPGGFKVEQAQVISNQVWLTLGDGRAWVDGHLVHMERIGDSHQRIAWYLGSETTATITDQIRDAVVLEVWQEALSAFQVEDLSTPEQRLLEPALGGPDTSERLHMAMAFRLLRLQPGENCRNIQEKLDTAFQPAGKLEVTLKPEEISDDECPVIEGGGYTGFEHNLYRIEIAQVNESVLDARFKWSAYNGGLVGRGNFEEGEDQTTITITANLPAITATRLKDFYLEVVRFDLERGYWRVVYGAEVVLDGNVLTIQEGKVWFNPTEIPMPSGNVFFRLWNGLARVNDYPTPVDPNDANMLRDGIRLAFNSLSKLDYRPGDYWVFAVRVGEKRSETPLLPLQSPQGIQYHRVPLAILNWNTDQNISWDEEQIDDCRRIFKPLTQQKLCCTYTIGNGSQSQGDFNSAEEALRQLPDSGGQLCFLPGEHKVNLVLENLNHVRITGCGMQTILHPCPETPQAPILKIVDSQAVQIDHLTLVSLSGSALCLQATSQATPLLQEIRITENQLIAHKDAIQVLGGSRVQIDHNHVAIIDKAEGGVGIFLQAVDSVIEDNQVVVVPAPAEQPAPSGEETPGPGTYDPCADDSEIYSQAGSQFWAEINYILSYSISPEVWTNLVVLIAYQALGGIQIGSSSERVSVRRNQISGGSGNGITLGHLPQLPGQPAYNARNPFVFAGMEETVRKQFEEQFEGVLYDLLIQENEIYLMGLSGIGVVAFFDWKKDGFMISLSSCTIQANIIQSCALQPPANLPAGQQTDYALGGIALMDAEQMFIHRNRIENNGLSHLQPVCGIWIQQVERLEICDNRILNNGPRVTTTTEEIQPGQRGGIVIKFDLTEILAEWGTWLQDPSDTAPSADGVPAAKIHDNVVVQPLGHALWLGAMGPISIVNNHFTSQGVDTTNYASQLASVVAVGNLGVAKDFLPFAFVSYRQMATVNLSRPQSSAEPSTQTTSDSSGPVAAIDFSQVGEIGLTQGYDLYKAFMYMPTGQILYNDNRVTMDLRPGGPDMIFSAQALISLDDISYVSNQSECTSLIDFAFLNTLLVAFSVRTSHNRFQEGMTLGLPTMGYSLFSLGLMNSTIGNQSTNCLLPLGLPAWTWTHMNSVVIFQRCQETLRQLGIRLRLQTGELQAVEYRIRS